MGAVGRWGLIAFLWPILALGCGGAKTESPPVVDRPGQPLEVTAGPSEVTAGDAGAPVAPVAPDAGPSVAMIPTCHRLCHPDHQHGCGHWEQVGRPGGVQPPPAARPPRWLPCDPACCDPAAPSQVEAAPVALSDLVMAVSFETASRAITSLGGKEISVYCPSEGWQPIAAEQREVAPCPAGRVVIGSLVGKLEVVVTRELADPSIAEARLIITAENDSPEWSRQMRAMLLELSGGTVAGGSDGAELFELGAVTASLEAGTSTSPTRLHLRRAHD